MRSQICAATPRLCVAPWTCRNSSFSSAALQDLGLDGHIQRRGRFIRQQQLGVGGQRDNDDHALAHSPENWCGYSRMRCSGLGMPTRRSSSTARACFPHLKAPGSLKGFRYLLADAQHGSAPPSLLEDHADLFARTAVSAFRRPKLLPAVAMLPPAMRPGRWMSPMRDCR